MYKIRSPSLKKEKRLIRHGRHHNMLISPFYTFQKIVYQELKH